MPDPLDIAGQLLRRVASVGRVELGRYSSWASGMLTQVQRWSQAAEQGATCGCLLKTPAGLALCRGAAIGRCWACENWCCLEHAFVNPSRLVCAGCAASIHQMRQPKGPAAQAAPAAPKAPGMSRDEAFKVLRLTPDASLEEIRAKYKKLVFRNHPDKSKDEEDRLRRTSRTARLNAAFVVLTTTADKVAA